MDQGSQWNDHPQVNSLYDAEGAWMRSSGAANKRLGLDEAQDFLHSAVGRKVKLLVNPELSRRDKQGNAIEPIAYMAHKGNLIVNPSVVGNSFQTGFLTHEATHLLGHSGHGPNMAGRHLQVVRRTMGKDEFQSLQDHYDRFKVKY